MILDLYSGKSVLMADAHTVPSSRFTRPASTADVLSSPPPSPSPFQQATTISGPQSPRSMEPKIFSRPPLAHPKTSTSSSAIEALTRQMGVSNLGSNDSSVNNGQPNIVVKDAKVTPSSELFGAVTRAKDSKFN